MKLKLTESIKLSNGKSMPIFGLGTWLSKPGEVENALRIALDNGYRLIDTAELYKNEEEIGNVLQEYFTNNKLKREDIFVTTKWNPRTDSESTIKKEIEKSLKRLKLSYVDLYLLHAPVTLNKNGLFDVNRSVENIWKEMEEVYEAGLAKSIGVSNFSINQVERIMKIAKIPIHNIQVEAHLYFPQFELKAIADKYNISFTAYAPLGSPGSLEIRGAKKEENKNPLEDPIVQKLSTKYSKTPAQILMRYLIQRGMAIIPKSTNEKRIIENSQIFDFKISPEEMEEMNNINYKKRLFKFDIAKGHPEDPYANERNT
ncbi:Alcohol dehydrogenase [NADP(+)] [Strongyloides ratti]|uniref:Alcohol dehydrogenase [NADP(+)] n=1 Tax=Strongyloides ratti TaxID=34506 RepID=A0A090LAK1_STRRB|nr:Alcohol dehydrogenase [NADP(+)] [Strongyloides ratti]CEF66811.1 Alcohol dehydrogenase [NADP(+)] [Strongyloides ratti]